MKRKIIAISIILIFVGLSISSANASIKSENKKEELLTLIYQTIKTDGSINEESVDLTKEEANTFQNVLSEIIDTIQSEDNSEKILDKIIDFLKEKFSNLYNKLKLLLDNIKTRLSKVFIISYGKSYKLNPFKKNEVKLSQKFSAWYYYCKEGLFQGKTLMFKPLKLKAQVLDGIQFGYMADFKGLYFYIAKKIPEQSFTFFFGSASKVIGFDFNKPYIKIIQ